MNFYLLYVPRLPSQPASSGRGWVIDFIWLEMPWQYIAMTRINLSIILISLRDIFILADHRYCFADRKKSLFCSLIWICFEYIQKCIQKLLLDLRHLFLWCSSISVLSLVIPTWIMKRIEMELTWLVWLLPIPTIWQNWFESFLKEQFSFTNLGALNLQPVF